jgi:hypothetical protein
MTQRSPWAHEAPSEPICLPDHRKAAGAPPLPTARLRLEAHPTNPPRPTGCVVQVDGRLVAVLTLDEVRAIARRIDEMEVAVEHA